MEKNIKYYIGIDSGGTKTDMVFGKNHNKIFYDDTFKSYHYSHHGAEKITDSLSDIILKTIQKNKLTIVNCKGMCIGIAGARNKEDKDSIKKILSRKLNYNNIIIESDSAIGLYGAFNGSDGVILISGTGSVAYAKNKGKFFQTGGWGKIIGDIGSGYQIGVDTLKIIADEYDREIKGSLLQKTLYKQFGITKENLIRKIYHENFDVQKIAKTVIDIYAKLSEEKNDIILRAVESLTTLVETIHKKAKLKKEFKIACIGSLIDNENYFRNELRISLKNKFPKIKITKPKYSPVIGALLMAKNIFPD